MQQAKFLITGAMGDTGGYAIEQLLGKDHPVRALVHSRDDRSKLLEDRGVEVVAGDYLYLAAMRTAVKGVCRAYYVYPIRPGIIQATAYFAQAAKEAGVEAVGRSSRDRCALAHLTQRDRGRNHVSEYNYYKRTLAGGNDCIAARRRNWIEGMACG